MKSYATFCVVLLGIEFSAQAQSSIPWHADSSNTVQNLNGVTKFSRGLPLCAVGTAGTIRTSSEFFLTKVSIAAIAQQVWTTQNSGTVAALNAAFGSNTKDYIAGAGGILLESTNGSTWAFLTSGITTSLYSGFFVTSTNTAINNVGYVVGGNGTIIKTTNGGANWVTRTSGTSQTLYSVFFTDTATGYAVGGNGTIIKTTNGGTSWLPQSSGTAQALYSITFTNSNLGYAVGAGGILIKTTNGGATWTSQASGTTRTLRSISFGGTNIGAVVGDSGTIFGTSNGGTTWLAENGGTLRNLNGVNASITTVIAVGAGGIILEKDLQTGAINPRTFFRGQSLGQTLLISTFYDLRGRRLTRTSPGFFVFKLGADEQERLFPLLQTAP